MTVPFSQIPSNLLTPLFYAELDASHANTAVRAQRALLIGQITAAATLLPNVPVNSRSQAETKVAAGLGSILSGMIDAYRANDAAGEMWVLPIDDDPNGIAAIGSIAFAGNTTATGAVPLYVAGVSVPVIMASGSSAAQTATAVAATINATLDLPVAAVVDGVNPAKVNLTARNAGECGNDIDVRVAYLGPAAGEAMPAGMAAVVTPLAGGVGNPSIATAIANLQDREFDFIVCALTDATARGVISDLLKDEAGGRWSWTSQTYGHCMIAKRGTAGTLAAFAAGIGDQHISCVGYNDSPTPPWKWAAAFFGACAVSLRLDPAVPQQYLTVAGVLAPPPQSEFPLLIRNNSLLSSGVSTWFVDAIGNVVIENIVTTYISNAQGQPDNSYVEIETLFTLMFVLRFMSSRIQAKFSRVKLAADGVRLLPGSNVVTPSTIRAEIITAYRELEERGFVQQSDVFAANLVVEKNAANPNRVDVLWPAVLINQLRVFALLAQFRNA